MNTVIVRNVVIGEGIPKICVPITEKTRDEILSFANGLDKTKFDLVEWRVDWFDNVHDFDEIYAVLKELRTILVNTPLLFTFRSHSEGGHKSITTDEYLSLNTFVIKSKLIDLVDVELFLGDNIVGTLVQMAHQNNVKVIVSNHDFRMTPDKDVIISRLNKMQELNADILKIAVMPTCKKDVITLLEATDEMVSHHATQPIVTMSMARDGIISRLCGEVFGSAITFGAVGKVSAPGQVNVTDLRNILDIIHKSINDT